MVHMQNISHKFLSIKDLAAKLMFALDNCISKAIESSVSISPQCNFRDTRVILKNNWNALKIQDSRSLL